MPNFPDSQHTIFLFAITENEIHDIISKMDEKFSAGDDEISNALVKLSCSITIPYLTKLINQTFIEGTFPNALKRKQKRCLSTKLDRN